MPSHPDHGPAASPLAAAREAYARGALSRRAALSGLGALGLVAGSSALPAVAAEAPAPNDPFLGAPRAASPATSPTAAGLHYVTVLGFDFHLVNSVGGLEVTQGGGIKISSQSSMTQVVTAAILDVPDGAHITELVVYASSTNGTDSVDITIGDLEPDAASGTNAGSDTAQPPASTTPVATVIPCDLTVDAAVNAAAVIAVFNGQGVTLSGVRVGYTPRAHGLRPITPVRVYDSRAATPARGPLTPGMRRVVSVADARNVDGSVATSDIVPVGATAVFYNLTVTDTVGRGYVGVAPGNATSTPASAINWWGPGQVLANASLVAVAPDRTIALFGNGGSADVVIDVVGYVI